MSKYTDEEWFELVHGTHFNDAEDLADSVCQWFCTFCLDYHDAGEDCPKKDLHTCGQDLDALPF
jgi:hypothetical protein